MIVNLHREQKIQRTHEEIIKIYQSLQDILGRIEIEEIDFENVPFQYEIDQTRELLNKSEDAEQNSERIEWAKNKADWYDPVVSKEDPIFA